MTNDKPTGTYGAFNLWEGSRELLSGYCDHRSIPNRLAPDEFHVTVLYSRKVHPDYEPHPHHIFTARAVGLEMFDTALVVLLDCPELVTYHEHLMTTLGATYDFPVYRPHVALSYDAPAEILSSLPNIIDWPIVLVGEFRSDLKE